MSNIYFLASSKYEKRKRCMRAIEMYKLSVVIVKLLSLGFLMDRINLKFSTVYGPVDLKAYNLFDNDIGKIFKKHWPYFKQINLQNFEKEGAAYAEVARDISVKNAITLLKNIYQDWIDHLNGRGESHYDGIFVEFRDYMLSPNSYFYQNCAEMLENYSCLCEDESILEVFSSTFSRDNPDVIQDWYKTGKKKTALQRHCYNYWKYK